MKVVSVLQDSIVELTGGMKAKLDKNLVVKSGDEVVIYGNLVIQKISKYKHEKK